MIDVENDVISSSVDVLIDVIILYLLVQNDVAILTDDVFSVMIIV